MYRSGFRFSTTRSVAARPVSRWRRRDAGMSGSITVSVLTTRKSAVGKPSGRVSQRAGGAEDLRLREQAQLREIHRAFAQMAFDLFSKMMKIDARFEDAVSSQPREVRPDQAGRSSNGRRGLGIDSVTGRNRARLAPPREGRPSCDGAGRALGSGQLFEDHVGGERWDPPCGGRRRAGRRCTESPRRSRAPSRDDGAANSGGSPSTST